MIQCITKERKQEGYDPMCNGIYYKALSVITALLTISFSLSAEPPHPSGINIRTYHDHKKLERDVLSPNTNFQQLRSEWTSDFEKLLCRNRIDFATVSYFKGHWDQIREIIEGTVLPPDYLEVLISDVCNANCVYCRGGKRHHMISNHFISQTSADQLAEDILRSPVRRMRLSGYVGDPFAAQAYSSSITLGQKLSKTVSFGVVTNGIGFDQKAQETFINAEYVNFSLDAMSEEEHFRLKGRKGFEIVLKHIRDFCSLKSRLQSNVSVRVSFIMRHDILDRAEDIIRELKQAGVNIIIFKTAMKYDDQSRLTPGTWEKIEEELEKLKQRYSDEPDFKVVISDSLNNASEILTNSSIRPSYPRCYFAEHHLTLFADGFFRACCDSFWNNYQIKFGHMDKVLIARDWQEIQRQLKKLNPAKHCSICPRFPNSYNILMNYLSSMNSEYPGYLDWFAHEGLNILSSQCNRIDTPSPMQKNSA
ncbi:MAG: radical SAM protein [Candidatus Aureabacteria bacterium]|nr:radical SAM protein [Candidatus Auribacterota bacterium]